MLLLKLHPGENIYPFVSTWFALQPQRYKIHGVLPATTKLLQIKNTYETHKCLILSVVPAGIEPATQGFSVLRSTS